MRSLAELFAENANWRRLNMSLREQAKLHLQASTSGAEQLHRETQEMKARVAAAISLSRIVLAEANEKLRR